MKSQYAHDPTVIYQEDKVTKRKRLTKGERQLMNHAEQVVEIARVLTEQQRTEFIKAILMATIASGADVLISQYGFTTQQCTAWGLETIAKTQRTLTGKANESTTSTSNGHQQTSNQPSA